ncbi:MAG: hypothetical protein V5A46_04620, partial [Haloferacaceae archaeon]
MAHPAPDAGGRAAAVSVAVLLLVASVGVASPGAAAQAATNSPAVEGTPHLNASAPDARFDPGVTGTLGVSITNDATVTDDNRTHPPEAIGRATEARSVRVNVTDTRDAPLSVETGEQSIGTVEDGETSGPHGFEVVVDEDAPAGTYEVEVTTRYRHAERVAYEESADGDLRYDETVTTRTET